MKFYGLHFIGDDKTPLQVRVDTATQQVFARTCPRGGEWTPWRRLDVLRNADGTLAEEVAEATHAKRADAAGRLSRSVKITFGGDVLGEVSFDGSADVSAALRIPGLEETGGIGEALAALSGRVERVERILDQMGDTSGGGG